MTSALCESPKQNTDAPLKSSLKSFIDEEQERRKSERYYPNNHPLQEEILIALRGVLELCQEWEADNDCEAYKYWTEDVGGLHYQVKMFESIMSSTVLLREELRERCEEHARQLLEGYEERKARAQGGRNAVP